MYTQIERVLSCIVPRQNWAVVRAWIEFEDESNPWVEVSPVIAFERVENCRYEGGYGGDYYNHKEMVEAGYKLSGHFTDYRPVINNEEGVEGLDIHTHDYVLACLDVDDVEKAKTQAINRARWDFQQQKEKARLAAERETGAQLVEMKVNNDNCN